MEVYRESRGGVRRSSDLSSLQRALRTRAIWLFMLFYLALHSLSPRRRIDVYLALSLSMTYGAR